MSDLTDAGDYVFICELMRVVASVADTVVNVLNDPNRCVSLIFVSHFFMGRGLEKDTISRSIGSIVPLVKLSRAIGRKISARSPDGLSDCGQLDIPLGCCRLRNRLRILDARVSGGVVDAD